jgi:hypothetical protein
MSARLLLGLHMLLLVPAAVHAQAPLESLGSDFTKGAKWFDEKSAIPWTGKTHAAAGHYCRAQGMELCTYSAYCPMGPGRPPVGGRKTGDRWSPVSDRPNQWVQVGTWGGNSVNTCMGHHEIVGGKYGDPAWGTDQSRHAFMEYVLCCPTGSTPKWFDDTSPTPWKGSSWQDGKNFCDANFMELCPYEVYCPSGGGSAPMGGVRTGPTGAADFWSPVSDTPNQWVQLGVWGYCPASKPTQSSHSARCVTNGVKSGQSKPGGVPCTGWYNGKKHTDLCTGNKYGGHGWCGAEAPPGETGLYKSGSKAWGGCSAACVAMAKPAIRAQAGVPPTGKCFGKADGSYKLGGHTVHCRRGVAYAIWDNDSNTKNDIPTAILQKVDDIRAKCRSLGLKAIRIKSAYQVDKVLRPLLQKAGYNLQRGAGVPLAHDYAYSLHGKITNMYQALDDSGADVMPILNELYSKFKYTGDYRTSQGKQDLAGLGWGASKSDVGVEDWGFMHPTQALICSDNSEESTPAGPLKCKSFGQTSKTQVFKGKHAGQQNTCLGHHEIDNGAHHNPAWGLDGRRHGFMKYILCCPRGMTAARHKAGSCTKPGYENHQIDVTSVDHEQSGIVGQYFNFQMAELPGLRKGKTMYLNVVNSRTHQAGEVVVWGADGNGDKKPGDAHGRFTGNPVKPAPGQWKVTDTLITECAPAKKQTCNAAGITMNSPGQCRPHSGLVKGLECATVDNPGGSCSPKVASRKACEQLLAKVLAGPNRGKATAAEYSGDSRQICWVVAGAKPRPNGKRPYHCFHEFACNDHNSQCMEQGGQVSCECKSGFSSTSIQVLSVDHASGLTGQYFNFMRSSIGLKFRESRTMTVTVTSNSGGDSQMTGEIIVWGNPNGGSHGDAHGRFTSHPIKPAKGQFHVGDVLTTSCSKRKASMGLDCARCSTLAQFSACTQVVTQACCGGPGDKCVGGSPRTCDSECDDVLLPMQKMCTPYLQKIPGMQTIALELAKAVKTCPHDSDTEAIAGYTIHKGWCQAANSKYTNQLACPAGTTADACAALCTKDQSCSGFSTDQRGACSLSITAPVGVRTCQLATKPSWTFGAAVKGDGSPVNGNTCYVKKNGH